MELVANIQNLFSTRYLFPKYAISLKFFKELPSYFDTIANVSGMFQFLSGVITEDGDE